jgi:sugar phosphate isomerase/epimerase
MTFSRRKLLAGIAAGGMSLRPGKAQYHAGDLKPRTSPAICLYSQVLIKVAYDELGPMLKTLGLDGCDLTVMPGGHVDPNKDLGLHLMRAIEAINGAGLDVAVLSTAYTSLSDQTLNIVAGVAHEMGVPLLRAGHWKYPAGGQIEARLAEVQRDVSGLAALARAAQMTVVLRNVPGEFGGALWDTYMLIRGIDPHFIGYDFDAGNAAAGGAFESSLELVLPRIRMVTARDVYWKKDDDGWKLVPCPLGEGMVDWRKLFAALARARFTGPISLPLDYAAKDEMGAVRRDVEFLKKQLAAAYG